MDDMKLEGIQKLFELSRLFDFYGELLSQKSKQIVSSYVIDNMSLGEIAKELGQSRQAVRDTLIRCEAKLRGYEESLGLIAKFDLVSDILDKTEEKLASNKLKGDDSLKDVFEKIRSAIS